MQKKLLLFFMVASCAMVQAAVDGSGMVNSADNGTDVNKYSAYVAQLDPRYRDALVDSLTNNAEAIAVLCELIKKENTQEEAEKRHGQCDCAHTFGDPVNSKTGRKFQEFKNDRIEKNKINEYFKKTFSVHKQAIEQEVINVTVEELTLKYNRMVSDFRTLQRCSHDEICLRKGGVIWNEIISVDYLEQFCSSVYDPATDLVNEKGIPLTKEQIIAIAQKNQKTVGLVVELAATKREVQDKLYDILNPKKDDIVIDELNAQK